MKKVFLCIILIAGVLFSSCRNSAWDFPDHDYSRVYFATQFPVRTITLGTNYVWDNSMDNNRQFTIYATVGGFRRISNDIVITFRVDNSLVDGLTNVTAMPAHYYTLLSDRMIIRRGGPVIGGVTVQLTDAFFASPRALTYNYVIPLVITDATNVTEVLRGTPVLGVENPNRVREEDWLVQPKDFVLMAVQYINNWDGVYLRRGTDVATINGETTTTVRRAMQYSVFYPVPSRPIHVVEHDELITLWSYSLSELIIPLGLENYDGTNLGMQLRATFNSNQEAVISVHRESDPENEDIDVSVISVTGSGRYVVNGERNSFGNRDRDVLFLDYTLEFTIESNGSSDIETVRIHTLDTLVLRDRQCQLRFFRPEFPEDN